MTFASGIQVKYKNCTGVIEFVCDEYVTICIETYEDKFRSVCMLVYPSVRGSLFSRYKPTNKKVV